MSSTSPRRSPIHWERLAERFDERELIELTMLVGHYHMLAFALNSFEVEPDEWLEGLP